MVTVENYRPLWGREGIHTLFSTLAKAPGGNLATLGSLVIDKQGSTQRGIYDFQLYPKGGKEGVICWEGGLATWSQMGKGTWWKEKTNSPKSFSNVLGPGMCKCARMCVRTHHMYAETQNK